MEGMSVPRQWWRGYIYKYRGGGNECARAVEEAMSAPGQC